MNPREMYFSNHWNTERQDRAEEIDYILNNDWGVVVCKAWDYRHNNWQFITSTGLMFVMDACELFIVTMYIPRKEQFERVFRNAGMKPSKELVRRSTANHLKWKVIEENTKNQLKSA